MIWSFCSPSPSPYPHHRCQLLSDPAVRTWMFQVLMLLQRFDKMSEMKGWLPVWGCSAERKLNHVNDLAFLEGMQMLLAAFQFNGVLVKCKFCTTRCINAWSTLDMTLWLLPQILAYICKIMAKLQLFLCKSWLAVEVYQWLLQWWTIENNSERL